MKTIKIDDENHARLTAILGHLIKESEKLGTYNDAITDLTKNHILVSPELISEANELIHHNRQLGISTLEEFAKNAFRFYLDGLKGNRVQSTSKCNDSRGKEVSEHG